MRETTSKTTIILGGVLAGYAILVAALVWVGGYLVDAGGLVPDTYGDAEAPLRAANLLTAVDQVITMLFTLTVGLLIGVGFILRDRDFRMGLSSITQMVFLVVLSLSTVCSVYFGYMGRMQAVRIAHYSLGPYTAIDEAIDPSHVTQSREQGWRRVVSG